MFLLMLLFTNVNSEYVTVDTKKGKIIGISENNIRSFIGIPYCYVNDIFRKCEETRHFKEPFQAFNNGNISCPHIRDDKGNGSQYFGTKQCLTLNIYVPQTVHFKLPILVWFHGESLWWGDANDYRSPYLVKHEIIFISVNFRVGPYGFFCPNEYIVPGNEALRDQIAALKWIQENIEAFEGDPNAVTIGGSGYGGSYVNLHLYGKWHRKLFDKVIIQSGSVFSNPLFLPYDRWYPVLIANRLGRPTGKYTLPRDVLPFLKGVDPKKLLEAAQVVKRQIGICQETKVGSQNVMTGTLHDLSFKKNVARTHVLVGYNSMEMLGRFAKNNTEEYYADSGDIIYKEMEKCFRMTKDELHELSNTIIKAFYFGTKDYGPDTILNLSQAISEFCISNGIEHIVTKFVEAGATVYKYLFSYTGASEYRSIEGSGAPHGEELKFLFDWRDPISGTEQEALRYNMVQMWANFVKYGNPTPHDIPTSWTPLHGAYRPYLDINENLTMMNYTCQKSNAFWRVVWKHYHKKALLY